MKYFSLLIFLLTISGTVWSQPHERYLAVALSETKSAETLTRRVVIDRVQNDTAWVYATKAQIKQLQQEGWAMQHAVPARADAKSIVMAESVAEMANWDRYPTYEVYKEMMNQFAAHYPNLCTVESIGQSGQGRELLVARISDNVGTEEYEPEVFYTSTMHGDETTGFILMLRLMDYLLSNYGTDDQVTRLVNELDIFINPNANPDGTYYGGDNTVADAIRGNQNGVDINRNFPDPDNGPHPDGRIWQPETKVMMQFAESRHIVLSANFHGGAEVANYPWDTWSRSHPDNTWFDYISHVYADQAIANGPSGYFTGISPDGVINGYDWYPVAGGRQDYMTYYHQAREVTMEISETKLPPSSDLPDYWQYNREALLLYLEEALYGIRGTVTNALSEPLQAKVVVENHDTRIDSSMVFTDSGTGNYHRLIAPGTYSLTFSAEGYQAKTIDEVEVQLGQATELHVVLTRPLPELSVQPNRITDTLSVGQTAQYSLHITNIGGDTLRYTLSLADAESTPQLHLTSPGDTLLAGDTTSHGLLLQASGAPATLTTEIVVTPETGDIQRLPVHIQIIDQPLLQVSPLSLDFTLPVGQQDSAWLTVNNTGADTLHYSLKQPDEAEAPWLQVEGLPRELTIETDTIWVKIDGEKVISGTYQADLVFRQTTKTDSQVVTITAVLQPLTGITKVHEAQAMIYPVPATSHLMLSAQGILPGQSEARIIALDGQQWRINLAANSGPRVSIPIHWLPPGVYLLQWHTKAGGQQARFIKQ